MAKPHDRVIGDDLGSRLAEVAEILDRAVVVLADTLAEVRKKEDIDDHGLRRPGAVQDDGHSE